MHNQENELRADIARMLASGLKTQTEPVPQNGEEHGALLAALQELGHDHLQEKLVLAGLISHPHGADGAEQMRCRECMYYLLHRKWCDLPLLKKTFQQGRRESGD